MFLTRLLNQGNAPLLEQLVRFTAARHQLLAENVVNVDTPNYVQRDLSVEAFQSQLMRRLEDRKAAGPGQVGFDGVMPEEQDATAHILFHDGNNRSKEQLMTELARNAMMHNMALEMLKKQFDSLESALRERMV